MSKPLFEVNSTHVISVGWATPMLCVLQLTCGASVPIDCMYMDRFTVTIFAPSSPEWSCEVDCDFCKEKKEDA